MLLRHQHRILIVPDYLRQHAGISFQRHADADIHRTGNDKVTHLAFGHVFDDDAYARMPAIETLQQIRDDSRRMQ
ncbi:hypothetical protein D3C81_1991090 [compost metagenome]